MGPGGLLRDMKRARRGVSVGLVAVLLLLAAGAYLIGRDQVQQRQALSTQFDTRQATAARFIEAYVTGVFTQERKLTARAFTGPVTPDSFARTATNEGYDAAVLVAADGSLLAVQPTNPAVIGKDVTKYPHLRTALGGVPAVSPVVISVARGLPVVAFAVPFETPQGRRVFSGGYAVEDTPLAPFVRNVTPYQTAQVLVLDAKSVIVAGNGAGEAGRPLRQVNPALAGVRTRTATLGSGAQQQYVTQGPIAGTTWRMVFAINTQELFAPVDGPARWFPWVGLALAGIAALLALLALYRYLIGRARLVESVARERRQQAGQEAEVQRSESAFRAAFDDALVGMSLTSPDGRFIRVNAVFAAMIGRPIDEMVGTSVTELTHPDDRPGCAAHIQRTLSGEADGFSDHTRYLRADGSIAHVDLSSVLIRDAEGTPMHFSTQTVDVTDRHVLQRERDTHLGMLTSVIAVNQSLIYVKDLDGRYLLANARFERAFDVTEAELIGKDDTYLDPDLAPVWRLNDLRAVQGEIRIEEWSDTEEGRRYYDSVKLPLFDGDGAVYATCGISLDVTEHRQAAAAMAAARDAALAATAAKSAFLATMSHEIRTPMNAVIGMTGLLLATDLNAEQRDFTETVRNSGDALLTVINDILDFSKIEAGDLELDAHPFELRECVESALAVVAVAVGDKDLELVADLDDSCPAVVVGDITRFRQVMINLLSNAVKFTPRGEIVLAVRAQTGTAEGPVRLHVTVRDTGIGIPADRLDRLFHSFSQVDSSTTRVYGGTGLGLAISRRLVEAMGGTLDVVSEVGTGSTFMFSVEVTGSADQRVPSPHDPGGSLIGRSVLVVDDNATNRRVLQMVLGGWGMVSTEMEEPAAALALVAGGSQFDVAILDMHMPGMDGQMLASALRETPAGRDLPLVLLSSLQSRLEPTHKALFVARLTKPAKTQLLRERLLEALAPAAAVMASLETAGGRREHDAPVAEVAPLRILLAEDNPINQKVARLMLASLGHTVDMVSDGAEAVAAVHRAHYDVVLMDVHMPELDGLAATRQIRGELPSHRQPFIAAMTASALIEDRTACVAAGMDDYLAKPVRAPDLAALLAHVAAGPRPAAAWEARRR